MKKLPRPSPEAPTTAPVGQTCCHRVHVAPPQATTFRQRKCCLEAYMTISVYFGPGEVTQVHCDVHGDVRVRSDAAAAKATDRNVAHIGGVLGEAMALAQLARVNAGGDN
jgi:hypothetical protein